MSFSSRYQFKFILKLNNFYFRFFLKANAAILLENYTLFISRGWRIKIIKSFIWRNVLNVSNLWIILNLCVTLDSRRSQIIITEVLFTPSPHSCRGRDNEREFYRCEGSTFSCITMYFLTWVKAGCSGTFVEYFFISLFSYMNQIELVEDQFKFILIKKLIFYLILYIIHDSVIVL